MKTSDAIVIFLLVAFAALLCVSFINSRQTRARLINQKLSQLKRRVGDLEELSVALEALTGSTKLARVVLEDTIDTLNGMLQLDPNSQTLQLSRNTAEQRLRDLSAPEYKCNLYRLMNSDAAIARSQFHLNEAGRIVRKRQASGLVEVPEMNTYLQELSWAHLMVTVVSYVGQGHKAVRNGDVLKAYAFYRKAQQAAMGSTLPDERRHTIIKEVSEILGNKRKSLSTDLMPETEFNTEGIDAQLPSAEEVAAQEQ